MAKKAYSRSDERDAAAMAVRNEVEAQEKVRILIPAEPSERYENSISVGINGCFFEIPRGESVEVPQAIADILTRAKYI